jgi:hypothetical protein
VRGFAVILLVCLVTAAAAYGGTLTSASTELRQWQTATGKPPSKAEFAAVMAACEDRAKQSDKAEPIDICLADYGLHRVR